MVVNHMTEEGYKESLLERLQHWRKPLKERRRNRDTHVPRNGCRDQRNPSFYDMRTVWIHDDTKLMLDKLKKTIGAKSFDHVIIKLLHQDWVARHGKQL